MLTTGTSMVRRALGRTSLAAVMMTGVMMVTGLAHAGATIPTGWGSIAYPGVPDSDCGNEFAVDGAGNIYTIANGWGVQVYSPATGATTTLDGEQYFGGCPFYFTTDLSGTTYISDPINSVIYRITSAGDVSTIFVPFQQPGPLTTDAAGNLFYFDSNSGGIFEVAGGTGALTVVNYVEAFANSIAVAPDGSIYLADYSNYVLRVTTTSITPVGSGWDSAESVAVDGAGNVYVADESQNSLTKITPSGVQDVMTEPPGAGGYPDEVFVAGASIYYYDENNTSAIYTLLPLVSGLQVTSTNEQYGGALHQTVTATWPGQSGAAAYTCTLMYGFGLASSFTTTTTSTTCSFPGLSLGTTYGIEVAAGSAGALGPASVAFATPAPVSVAPKAPVKRTIVCQKNHSQRIRVITRVAPRCPSGWHRIA